MVYCTCNNSVAVVLFIAFQFICSDAEWNAVNTILAEIEKTTFGKNVSDYIYAVDLAVGASMVFLIKTFGVNPFDKKKRNENRAERVNAYIEKHKLL